MRLSGLSALKGHLMRQPSLAIAMPRLHFARLRKTCEISLLLLALAGLPGCGKSSGGPSTVSANPGSTASSTPSSAPTPSAPAPTPPPAGDPPVTSVTLYNNGASPVSNQPITVAVAFQPGDVPSSSKIQILTNDGR